MDLSNLTDEQRDKLWWGIVDQREFWGRLRKRMDAIGWPADDPLRVQVDVAWEVAHAALRMVHGLPAVDTTPPPPPSEPRQPFTWPLPVGRPDPTAYPDVTVPKRKARPYR